MEKKTFIVGKSGKASRIIPRMAEVPYTVFNKSLRKKDVIVNGKRISKDAELKAGDAVEIYFAMPERKMFSVLYSDFNIVIVDKNEGCLSESVFQELKKTFPDVRFVHRLDRNTSGVMIFAIGDAAERELLAGFKKHAFIKKYRAVVKGKPVPSENILEAYLKKDENEARVKIFDRPVKGAVPVRTGYKVLSSEGETSVLEVRLFTGKTHQIRAHLAYIGYPIVGDGKYGDAEFNKKNGAKSQRLTAFSLGLAFEKESPLYYLNGKTFVTEK